MFASFRHPIRSIATGHRRAPAQSAVVLLALLVCFLLPEIAGAGGAPPGEAPLGFRPLPPSVAAAHTGSVPLLDPTEDAWDWRDQGIITAAKNQGGVCGGCWAFAAAGLIEAMTIAMGGSPTIDVAEQYPLSCDTEEFWSVSNDGCCGGTATVFHFFEENWVICEEEYAYGEGDFDGDGPRECAVNPPWDTIPCVSPLPDHCNWRVASWSLLETSGPPDCSVPDIGTMETALRYMGPLWLGYHVYQDFYDYWQGAAEDSVYTHTYGEYLGGHAVLCIGYNSIDQYWIVKNSWGLSGPNDDGIFHMAYDNDCCFGVNATWITVEQGNAGACCFAGGECRLLTEPECLAEGGVWDGGASCSPTTCPIVWACCSDDQCIMLTEEECDDGGGTPIMTWFPGWSCDYPEFDCATPAIRVSWGRVKSLYRERVR